MKAMEEEIAKLVAELDNPTACSFEMGVKTAGHFLVETDIINKAAKVGLHPHYVMLGIFSRLGGLCKYMEQNQKAPPGFMQVALLTYLEAIDKLESDDMDDWLKAIDNETFDFQLIDTSTVTKQ